MDKTVRLWHVSRNECLCTFKHSDFVPSIQFHPQDDRFFLAGSLDAKLRLWSIPDKNVAYSRQMTDMITAVSFTPDGKTVIAGTLSGICQFFETEGFKPQTQLHVRSNRGKNAKGSKITGIQTMTVPPDNPNGEVKLLISSNDSRVRLYNFRDKSLEAKYKGHDDNFSQIRASFSDDGRYIICGSEDRKAYIWSTGPAEGDNNAQQRPVEMFEAHASICTVAVVAPATTRQLLSSSEDPLYDLCNPPPVTLVGKAGSVTSSVPVTDVDNEGRPKDPHDTPRPDSQGTATNTRPSSVQQTPSAVEASFKRAEESPAYLTRSRHPGGNIIVTADYNGCIKVFRQDCAWQKRQRSELWDNGSINLRSRAGSMRSSIVGRTNSIATRTSRNSGSGRPRRDSLRSHGTQPAGERILSWRQAIPNSPAQNARSISPRKRSSLISVSSSMRPNRMSGSGLWEMTARGDDETPASRKGSVVPDPSKHEGGSKPNEDVGTDAKATATNETAKGTTTSEKAKATNEPKVKAAAEASEKAPRTSTSSPASSKLQAPQSSRPSLDKKKSDASETRRNPLWLAAGTAQSYMFWNKNSPFWSSSPKPSKLASSQTPPPAASSLNAPEADGGDVAKKQSIVSTLSSEQSSLSARDEADELRCPSCGGTAFSARVIGPKKTRLVCQECGRPVQ
jgi:WD repeat-containing protein 44